MAKVGDHVSTNYGNGTVMPGKKIQIHGKENQIISYAEDKKIIRGVVRTRLQVELDGVATYKRFLRDQKKSESTEVSEVSEKKIKAVKKSSSKLTPRTKKKVVEMVIDDFDVNMWED